MTWRDRPDFVRACPGLIELAAATGGTLLIVNYGGRKDLLARQVRDSGVERLRIMSIPAAREFNKPAAQNLGAAIAPDDVLFFCDCDVLLTFSSMRELIDAVVADEQAFGTVARVDESEPRTLMRGHIRGYQYRLHIRTADGRTLTIEDHEPDAITGSRRAPGLLLVRKSHFLEVEGFNSHLRGWGFADQDMIARLTLGLGLRRIDAGHAVHITHSDASRVTGYADKDRWLSRDRSFRHALANWDRGDFAGTFRFDVRALRAERVDVA